MTALSRAIAAATHGVRASSRWVLLTLAAIAFVLIWGLPTIIIPLETDQVTFALGARTILDGGQLYGDLWEIKPPLIYLIYTLPFALAGEHMEAIRMLDLINTALAMGAVFLLSRRFFNERAAILAAGFYGFTYLTWAREDGLAEVESFMAAPLALAFFLYRPEDERRRVGLRALAAGLLLGVAFALKPSALLFVLGLPAAELLLRGEGRWTLRGALRRLSLAALGFLLVQGAMAGYLAIGGALDEFVDIQRHYTAPYNAYRWAPDSSYVRFLLISASDWIRSMPFIVVPAALAPFFALRQPRHAAGVYFVVSLALLGVLGVGWQGKMFRYHWLVMVPLLAPLAGYAVDRVIRLFSPLARREAWAAWALLAGALLVLAFEPLLDTYDNYRTLVSFADGSLTRREVEARYNRLLLRNHELVDYVRMNGNGDDRLFVWGFWPVAYFWAERPLVSRFVANNGLRATWAPDSWRDELMENLRSAPPRFFAVARGDNQPWLVGTAETSDEHFRDSFPELRAFVEGHYVPVRDMELFLLYERGSPVTRIKLPEGFAASVVAEGLIQPTSVTLDPDGAVYVSQREGPVFRLVDGDGDGVFEGRVAYTAGISGIHGIAFGPQGALYLSNVGRVTVVRDTDGDTVSDAAQDVIQGLPHGMHENNGIAFGPDGKLYVTNGSTCNDNCVEVDERSATILQANPDGSELRVYARGVRNSYDLVFDPQGRLWATDNGSNPPCNTIDELDLIEEGGDYGWPYGPACDSFQSGVLPAADLGFNTAATGIDYYDGEQFPAEFQGNLFITLWGSLEEAPEPGGRILVRAVIDETPDGPRVAVEEFGTGFRRPIDVVVDRDGTLLVLDFGLGVLYRVVYTGG